METIKYYIEKYKIIILISTIILIIFLLVIFLIIKDDNKDTNLQLIVNDIEDKKEVDDEEPKKIKVDIKGYINNPGVYEFDFGSRVIDVINEAGGLKEEANTEYINLSKKIVDEMIIIIYSNNEVEQFKETDKNIIYIEYECECPDNINDVCIKGNDVVNTNGVKESKIDNEIKNNKVSINNGSLEELMTLTGIGESKAKAIIEYRNENGEFKSLEDIMNVSGIGESAYSKIKDNIKL